MKNRIRYEKFNMKLKKIKNDEMNFRWEKLLKRITLR